MTLALAAVHLRPTLASAAAPGQSEESPGVPMPPTTLTVPTPDGGAIPAFLAEPPAGPAPGLLIIPAIFGIDPGMQQLAIDVAAHGAFVMVLDPFWRTDPGVCGFDDAGFARGRARAGATDAAKLRADVGTALAALRATPGCNGKVAALGVCFGGRFAVLAGADGAADAVLAFHGGGLTRHLDELGRLTCPISLHFAGEDPGIPPADVEAVRGALAKHPDARVVVAPGVKHGYTHPTSPNYDAAAAALAHGDLLARLRALG